MAYIEKKIDHTLVTTDKITDFVKRLGKQISDDYRGKELYLICVLKGSFMFMADLIREIDVPCEIDFMSVSSYAGEKSTGVVKINKDLDRNISGKHVLIIEDIVDTGITLNHLMNLLSTRNPASLKLVTAFDKPSRRQIDIDVHYIGMEIPNEFIVGYGLDLDGFYRNLPDVVVLSDD
ncbi:MAG: hypoxanthine phosphoribosyltransferase [Clostridiales bacterium]|jgi:hypoxanthine phosphoribosyltransferase|nr:hypoxanthine phosphoribosyltransferase [Clostridiales bacterium]MCK9351055.1 hypoxanthine phosphoribosyltransferase [Clostridiales bacterium]MDD2572292.1 hypoxanthine phosphoribosyltransferase [Eubacteriales bacterium]MDD3418548.1 hypoxanthine phosphoribosyltransferase [Eubacteriales bacterium]MDD3539935.1 hypoxanthine phosphoribosyltransferase [Eubacteriales bacterium]